jgi:hypothetical protein
MKKWSLIASILFYSMISCSSDDDNGGEQTAAGPAFVKLEIEGSLVYNRSTNAPNPSSEVVNAIITTQSYTANGVTYPANSLSIFSGDQAYQTNGLGKSIILIVENITHVGTYSFTENNGNFFYSDKTDPVNTYISAIMPPYETTATVTITKIGSTNAAGNGKYVSGYIEGMSLSGPISNPNSETPFRIEFNGGVPD